MPLKLFVLIDGKYEPLSALAIGQNIKPVKKILITESINKYIENNLSNKTIKNQKVDMSSFVRLKEFLIDKAQYVDEIELEHFEVLQNQFLKTMKASSVKRRFSVFHSWLEKCIDWGYINENPLKKLKYKKIENNHFKVWSEHEYEKFISLCDTPYKEFLRFMWLTGCRPIEAINLKWSDIDHASKNIILRCDKNRAVNRFFPLDQTLDLLLHSIIPKGLNVFTHKSKPLNGDSVYQYAKHRLNKLGLNNLTIYGLRHSFSNRLSQEGVNAFLIQKLMGHADISTTMTYQNFSDAQILESLQKIRKN
jgi:integrase/recombinase XerD